MMTDPDEITTDVDPSWVALIRAGARPPEAGPGPDASPAAEPVIAEPVNAEPVNAGGDWTDVEPAWDPEATVGVSDGLLERIRQEIGTTTPPEPTAVPAAPTPALASPTAAPASPSPGPVPPSNPVTTPEPGIEQLASTTVRWEPRQRLTSTAPVTATAVIAPPTTRGVDRTKVALAAIAALALIVVAWLFIGSRGGDDAPPTIDSVPTSAGEGVGGSTIPAVSAPVQPVDPDDGAGG